MSKYIFILFYLFFLIQKYILCNTTFSSSKLKIHSYTYKQIKRVPCFNKVVDNLKKYTKASKKSQSCVWSKFILVPGINDNEEEINKILLENRTKSKLKETLKGLKIDLNIFDEIITLNVY